MQERPDLPMLESVKSDDRFMTDSSGLTVSRFVGKLFIPWSDIQSAQTKWRATAFSGRYCELQTCKRKITIPRKDHYLIASVWQHLRRIGKEEGFELTEGAKALWRAIPDDIPHEMVWEDKSPKRTIPRIIIVGFLCACLWFGLYRLLVAIHYGWMNHTLLHGFMAVLGIEALILLPFKLPCSARRFVVTEYGFEADTRLRKYSASWDEITHVNWHKGVLTLRLGWFRWVNLLWLKDDESSRKLILSIIRRLRMLNKPLRVPVPEALLPKELELEEDDGLDWSGTYGIRPKKRS